MRLSAGTWAKPESGYLLQVTVPDTKRGQHIQLYLKENQKVWPAFVTRPVVEHPVMGGPPETLTYKGTHGYERHWRTSKERVKTRTSKQARGLPLLCTYPLSLLHFKVMPLFNPNRD